MTALWHWLLFLLVAAEAVVMTVLVVSIFVAAA